MERRVRPKLQSTQELGDASLKELVSPNDRQFASNRMSIVLTNPPFGEREEDGIESNLPKHFQTRETADLFLAPIIRILKADGRAAVVLPDGSLFGHFKPCVDWWGGTNRNP
jgi:type I restriction-modification system DNA methylase subunit